MIRLKRVYDPPAESDGERVLVDRLWPRGLSKARAHVDEWRKDLAPSDELRKWFAHDPRRFREFRARYKRELRRADLGPLARHAKRHTVTLVYGARDEAHNNAVVLAEALSAR